MASARGTPSSASPTTRLASRRSHGWKFTPRETCGFPEPRVPRIPAYRCVFRTTEVQLKCYAAGGPDTSERSSLESGDHSPLRLSGVEAVWSRSNGRRRRRQRGVLPIVVGTLPVPGRSCRRKPLHPVPGRLPRGGQGGSSGTAVQSSSEPGPWPRCDGPARGLACKHACRRGRFGCREQRPVSIRRFSRPGASSPRCGRAAAGDRLAADRRRARSSGSKAADAIAKTCRRTSSPCPRPMGRSPFPSCRERARWRGRATKPRPPPRRRSCRSSAAFARQASSLAADGSFRSFSSRPRPTA